MYLFFSLLFNTLPYTSLKYRLMNIITLHVTLNYNYKCTFSSLLSEVVCALPVWVIHVADCISLIWCWQLRCQALSMLTKTLDLQVQWNVIWFSTASLNCLHSFFSFKRCISVGNCQSKSITVPWAGLKLESHGHPMSSNHLDRLFA